MTTHRPIILRELPATKTTDPTEFDRAAPYRYSAEWETPEHLDDETDPLWGCIGFGATEHDAYADLAANTVQNWSGQTDEEILGALGELAKDTTVLLSAADIADKHSSRHYVEAMSANSPEDRQLFTTGGDRWTQTASTLRRMPEPESTRPPPQTVTARHDAEATPETARALGELLLVMPPEVKRSLTFGITFRGSDGQYTIAVVATRDPKRIAEFVQTGLIAPASDTPLTDCPPNLDDQLTDEVIFTAPDGRVFTGSPADVGVEVAEALIDHEDETWSLPSVIREPVAEHLVRVLDATQWSPYARRAAYHLHRITTAAPEVSP